MVGRRLARFLPLRFEVILHSVQSIMAPEYPMRWAFPRSPSFARIDATGEPTDLLLLDLL